MKMLKKLVVWKKLSVTSFCEYWKMCNKKTELFFRTQRGVLAKVIYYLF